MTILLVLNRVSAKNVQLLVRLPSENLERKFRRLMEEKKHKEAFDLVYSKSQPSEYCYLDPEKMHYLKPPDYVLVEELIAGKQTETALV